VSLRLEMLQVARLAPTVLGPEAAGLVERFVLSKQNGDGGFANREGESDLYYTSFALDALTALQRPVSDKLHAYLAGHDPATLDFVHAACLARLWSVLSEAGEGSLQRLEAHRTTDGGYHQAIGAESGSTYAAFLAYGAYADHGRTPPDEARLAESVRALADPSGGWVNDRQFPIPNVPATAAGVALSRNLRLPLEPATTSFLMRAFQPSSGGFLPFPEAPLPDLLSTAVALHALDGLQAELARIQEPCLDYVDTLWTAEGGFFGQWDDDTLDLEYTYYGLLALGHLAL